MPRNSSMFLGIAFSLSLFTACSASSTGAGNGGSGGSGNSGAQGGGGQGAGDVGGFDGPGGNGGGGTTNPSCVSPAGEDNDGDGYSEDQGDCNDCDKSSNPGAVEVINTTPDMNGNLPPVADEDCDGTADNPVEFCDEGIALDSPDAFMGARAIDLCQQATAGDGKWGVLEAAYVRANGVGAPNPLQWGIKPGFGSNVKAQRGKSLLAISAGYARDAGDAEGCGSTTCQTNYGGTAPPGFPAAVPGCEGDTAINDDVALQLKIRAPSNATGYSFNFKFYSFEFPEWVCTAYNDQFIALVNPPPVGAPTGNISFDSKNNPVSVNIAFFDVCDPASASDWAANCFFGSCPPLPNPYCASGTAELVGTGFLEWDTFGYAGGTSWLKTQAPVNPGQEIMIRFAIWDTGDDALDSTALIDNFQWIATGGTVNVGTEVIPEPK